MKQVTKRGQQDYLYELNGLIEHSGMGLHSGHYFCAQRVSYVMRLFGFFIHLILNLGIRPEILVPLQ